LSETVGKQDDFANENQRLKEEIQNQKVLIMNLENEIKILSK